MDSLTLGMQPYGMNVVPGVPVATGVVEFYKGSPNAPAERKGSFQTASGNPQYKILKYINLDTPTATRSRYDIQVSEDKTDQQIRSILEAAIKELSQERDDDAMWVRVYLEGAGDLPIANGVWAPYGKWGEAKEGQPKSVFKVSIEVFPEHRPRKTQDMKHGLTLDQRKQVFREMYISQDKTKAMAEKKCPSDVLKQADYMDQLDKKYQKQIAEKYNITERDAKGILVEGLMNNWPH